MSQLWVFIVAPLLGGALAAAAYLGFYPARETAVRVDVTADAGSPVPAAAGRTSHRPEGA